MHWRGLLKADTIILKAVCILIIVLHNFFHVFPGMNIENEFTFKLSRFNSLKEGFTNAGFLNTLSLLFSYFGHYGVQAFIFLSSYGLYISYGNKKLRYWQFVKDRVSKLYPAFVLAVLLYMAIIIAVTKSLNQPGLYLEALLRLSFLSNLFPAHSFAMVGPWWFYSVIVQFYLLFPLLCKFFNRYGIAGFTLLSLVTYLMQLLFNNTLETYGLFINTTVIGHFPVFALGFILAKKNNIPMPGLLFVVASLLFYFGNYNEFSWVFTGISALIITLYIYIFSKQFFHSKMVAFFKALLLFIGSLSMYIYAVNGFLRHPFMHAALKTDSTAFKLLITLGFVAFVVIVALLLRTAERIYFKLILWYSKNKLFATKPMSPEK